METAHNQLTIAYPALVPQQRDPRSFSMAAGAPMKPLILAGGRSARMQGLSKALLPLPDGRTLLQRCVDTLKEICGTTATVYVSVSRENKALFDDLALDDRSLELIVDQEPNLGSESAGPSAGLGAAHIAYPRATWMVVACDYPLLSGEGLRLLCEAFVPPVTCFKNNEGYLEPLVGIWTPDALAALKSQPDRGPAQVVRELGGMQLQLPLGHETCLLNVNTRDDWRFALEQMDKT